MNIEEKTELILLKHKQNALSLNDAKQELLDLFIVSGSNCCKQCKEPIEKGFRFCSGECKQYYYR